MAFQVAIVGAGIAGASLAAELAPHMSVLLLEAEDAPGFHATGRSAAFWSETYGGPLVQPLSSASGPFLENPPADFSDRGFLRPRGALTIGTRQDIAAVSAFVDTFQGSGVELHRLAGSGLSERVPGLRAAWDQGVWEPSTADIDVAALHAAYLRKAKRHGAVVAVRSRVRAMTRSAGLWALDAGDEWAAHMVVNAAGAWADGVAHMAGAKPLGIQPYRRTMVQLQVDAAVPELLPLVVDINEGFYFKPDGPNRLWLSPHDETASPACDAAPDELDVAIAIDRFEKVMEWPVVRVQRSWAGLRSFAPDRLPIFGVDANVPGLFWCAGQGGFGIQTAPAIARLLAAQILSDDPGKDLSSIDASVYAPDRAGLKR